LNQLNEVGQLAVVWGLATIGAFYLLTQAERAFRRWKYGPPKWKTRQEAHQRSDQRQSATSQLETVMASSFTARPVMNKSEYNLFRIVEEEVRTNLRGCRVFSQTALGAVLEGSDRVAHSTINSKRADVMVISPVGMPMLVIEYQGRGHYQSDAAARDAVKREALRRARIGYLEVTDGHSTEQIRRLVREALGIDAGASVPPPPKVAAVP